MTNVSKWVIGVAVLIVIFFLGYMLGGQTKVVAPTTSDTTPTNPSGTGSTGAVANNPTSGSPAHQPTNTPGTPATTLSPPYITEPTSASVWKIATQNIISWTKEANVSGYIYLVDATTKNTLGVINPSTGPHQTSYTWNTRDILLSRTNPLGKTVTPGTYIIKISFDGNNLPVVSSPTFTISQ